MLALAYQIGQAVVMIGIPIALLSLVGSLGGNTKASIDRYREEAYQRARGII